MISTKVGQARRPRLAGVDACARANVRLLVRLIVSSSCSTSFCILLVLPTGLGCGRPFTGEAVMDRVVRGVGGGMGLVVNMFVFEAFGGGLTWTFFFTVCTLLLVDDDWTAVIGWDTSFWVSTVPLCLEVRGLSREDFGFGVGEVILSSPDNSPSEESIRIGFKNLAFGFGWLCLEGSAALVEWEITSSQSTSDFGTSLSDSSGSVMRLTFLVLSFGCDSESDDPRARFRWLSSVPSLTNLAFFDGLAGFGLFS